MSGTSLALLLAFWGQGALVLALYALLYKRRVPRVLRGEIAIADVAESADNWPGDARRTARAIANQFELPVLFFAGAGIALWLGALWHEAVLAWLFVLARIAQATIHVTTNHVPARFAAFATGFALTLLLWLDLLIRLLATPL